MRTILLAILAAALSMSTAFAAGPSYRVEVSGLACPFCAYAIEKKLGSIEGVERLETHIKTGEVIVVMEDGERLERERAYEAVEAAGFTLGGFEPVSGEAASGAGADN